MTARIRQRRCAWLLVALGLLTTAATGLFLTAHMWAEANAYATLSAFALTAGVLVLDQLDRPAYPLVDEPDFPQVRETPCG